MYVVLEANPPRRSVPQGAIMNNFGKAQPGELSLRNKI